MNRQLAGGFAAIVVVTSCIVPSRPAAARMRYFDAFKERYEGSVAGIGAAKCGICHAAKSTKYGRAFGEELGGNNVKDEDEIQKALEGTEKRDAGNGQTFGDILNEGRLP